MDIFTEIKNQRARIGLSQMALASRAGLSLATLQNIESGRSNPELKTLMNLLKALGLTFEIKAEAINQSTWQSFGLPLAEGLTPSPQPAPTRSRFIGEYTSLNPQLLDLLAEREKKAWVSFLSALHDHYPTISLQNSGIDLWLSRNRTKYLSPKLRRISLEKLGTFL